MTSNQRLVLHWLNERCSASGIIRVSSQEIANDLGLSQSQALKILWALEESERLQTLQKGKGRGPSKYRVLSRSYSSGRTSGNPQQVHSDAQKRLRVVTTTKTKREALFGTQIRENAQTNTHIRKRDVFDNVERPLKPVKTSSSPFKRFRGKWDRVEKWNSTDFVCYFSYVYKVRFGETPALNWPVECGAANTLLRRLKNPGQFKIFIQVAFSVCKRKPNGLRSFVYDYFYEQVINTDEDYIEKARDEYDDEYVLPWLEIESRRKGREATREYLKNLTLRSLGIYS